MLPTFDERINARQFATSGGELDLMQEICELAEERLTTEEVKNEILLRTDKWGNNVWQDASQEGIVDMLQKTWDFFKRNSTHSYRYADL